MKLIYCLMIILWPCLSRGQAFKPLNIGETVPNVEIHNIINYKTPTAKLSDFKGKLLILDFMNTACGSCLQNLIRFDSLQKVYKQKVVFLVITTQKKQSVKTFLQKSPIGKKISLPFITEDKTLQSLFPFKFISHIVWIAPDDVVSAITHSEYVTANNLSFILNGGKNNWPVKRDEPDFDYEAPLLNVNEQIKGIGNSPVFRSSLFTYIPNVAQYFIVRKDTAAQTIRTTFINQPITEMYLRLIGKIRFPHTQIVLNVKDRSRFIFNNSKFFRTQWDEKNRWCYESVLPLSMNEQERHSRIFNDLNFYFGIKANFEKRNFQSLVLERSQASGEIPAAKGDSITLWAIIKQLNDKYSGIPVFTSVPGINKIWIHISPDQVNNMASLKKILTAYGFKLVPEMRNVEVLVIAEQNDFTK